MSGLMQDLRYTLRMLAKAPGFTAVGVITLALGIGANTAIFSVVNAVLLRPLPYEDADRIVRMGETFVHPGGRGTGSISWPNLMDWQEQNRVFDSIGGWSMWSHNLTGGEGPIRVRGLRVTPEVFSTLGSQPLVGRFFSEGEGEPGNDRVVVLSFNLWQQRFGGEPIVGTTIGVDGENRTVIGIMPKPFQFPPRTRVDLWLPLVPTSWQRESRGNHWTFEDDVRGTVTVTPQKFL